MEGNGEGGGKLQGFIQAGNRPARQDLPAHLGEEESVFQLQIRYSFFRQGKNRKRQGRLFLRGLIGNGQHRFARAVFQLVRGDRFPVQREGDNRKQVRCFIGGSLIDDILSFGLPGQGFSVQREGFRSADVLNAGQHGPVRDFIQAVPVFQPDAVGQGFYRAVRSGHHIHPFMPGCFRECGRAAQRHHQSQSQSDPFFHNQSFLSYRRAFISRVVCTITLSRSSSTAGRSSRTTATLSSAPRAIRRHMEEMISTFAYRPTP